MACCMDVAQQQLQTADCGACSVLVCVETRLSAQLELKRSQCNFLVQARL
jgi:hypothetical protein